MIMVRPMTPADGPAVMNIYADGIATGQATFESEPPTWESFDVSRLPGLRLVATDVATDESLIIGWIAATAVSTRAVYRGVIEHSLYVDAAARGSGVGSALLTELIDRAERAGIWTIQSSIFPENEPSLRLHLRHGFRVVGTRERIGKMTYGPLAGQWRDTVLIERRSAIAE